MLAWFWVLLVLGVVLPVGALVVFALRARKERLRIGYDLAKLRVTYSQITPTTPQEKKDRLYTDAKEVLEKYGLDNMRTGDFDVLPLWIMSSISRLAVPNAVFELVAVGLGLACSAAASVVSLTL